MKTDNIIFFYPSKMVGGAEFLFARIANCLSKLYNKTVFYIDYKDGFIRTNTKFRDFNFLDFEDGKKTDLDIEGTIITPISNIYRVNDYINFKNDNIHLIFWTLHTYNLIHVMPEAIILEKFSADFNKFILKNFCKNTYNVFKYLLEQCGILNSIFHMDNTTYAFNKRIFEDALYEKYLPIASETKDLYSNGKIINGNEINIAILGRLYMEKTMSLLNVINNLDKLQTDKIKKIHIIGNGDCKKLIKNNDFKRCEIIFKDTLTGTLLDEYLINNVDILFAMGTSCLEGAALKLPVVVIPYSYTKFSLDKFHFLFESYLYTLGTSVKEYKKIAHYSMEDIINLVYNNNRKIEIGEKCYEYFCNTHSIETITNKLLTIINNNSLSINEYNTIKKEAGCLKTNKNLMFKIIQKWCKIWQKMTLY